MACLLTAAGCPLHVHASLHRIVYQLCCLGGILVVPGWSHCIATCFTLALKQFPDDVIGLAFTLLLFSTAYCACTNREPGHAADMSLAGVVCSSGEAYSHTA